MAYNKVVIAGINTSELTVLKEDEKIALLKEIRASGSKAAKDKLIKGEIKVFDTETFTVEGKELATYVADVDDMGDYKPDTEVVADGAFNESVKRSAPYFDLKVDGITRLNEKF